LLATSSAASASSQLSMEWVDRVGFVQLEDFLGIRLRISEKKIPLDHG